MPEIRVLKLDLDGRITWQYAGQLLHRNHDALTLEAYFDRPDLPFLDTVWKQGDRFVETFYADRWYNIFAIHDRDSGVLKGWYCNISRPAVLSRSRVAYVDLALDLWVSPSGTQTVLDEGEFRALNLEPDERAQALESLAGLRKAFEMQRPPS